MGESKVTSQAIRKIIIEQSKRAHVGHIGSALSFADIVAAVYGRGLTISDPDDPDRDRCIISKGHAALAVYAALHLRGWLTEVQLAAFHTDSSFLGVHPECAVEGIDFSTGSLGQGLPMGVGAALAGRMQGSSRRTFVLMSDAECNEGSTWEAVMVGAHYKLANLIAMIDLNGMQALGSTEEVLNLSPMSDRWRAFGWDVHEVDGHDPAAMADTIGHLDTQSGPPHVLVARTTFGKGVSFMEGQLKWHYMPMSDDEYARAVSEVATS